VDISIKLLWNVVVPRFESITPRLSFRGYSVNLWLQPLSNVAPKWLINLGRACLKLSDGYQNRFSFLRCFQRLARSGAWSAASRACQPMTLPAARDSSTASPFPAP